MTTIQHRSRARTQGTIVALAAILGVLVTLQAKPIPRSIEEPVAVVIASVVGVPANEVEGLKFAVMDALEARGLLNVVSARAWYRVDLVVEFGDLVDGRVPITLTWEVRDTAGDRIGTVEQRNTVARDVNLDRLWWDIRWNAIPVGVDGIKQLVRP